MLILVDIHRELRVARSEDSIKCAFKDLLYEDPSCVWDDLCNLMVLESEMKIIFIL